MKRPYILLAISVSLVILVIGAAIFVLFFTDQSSEEQVSSLPTPTQFPNETVKNLHQEEPPPPATNPEYLELLQRQPFWNMLPHYGKNFLVEYFQSDNVIRITTIDPGSVANRTELINQYRQEARDWLTENGAALNDLTIEYQPNIN